MKDEETGVKIAVVRVRGNVHVRSEIEDTMGLLNLNKVNHCVVIDNRPQYSGMINKINDYVTWGEIKPEVMEKLLKDKGGVTGNMPLTDDYMKKNTGFKSIKEFVKAFMGSKASLKDITSLKPVFRLKPPSRGYERGGIKKPYSVGGALGYRGEKINELITRML